MHYTKIKK